MKDNKKNLIVTNATLPIRDEGSYTYVLAANNLVIMSGELSINSGTPSTKQLIGKLSEKYKKTWTDLSKM